MDEKKVAYPLQTTIRELIEEKASELQSYGKQVYNSTENYNNFSNVMEHPEFRKFIDSFLENKDIGIIFIELYREIEKNFPNFGPYQKIGLHKLIMDDRETRSSLINEYLDTKRISMHEDHVPDNRP